MRTANRPDQDQITSIMSSVQAHWEFSNENETHNRLIMGDFNAHHHEWSGHRPSTNHRSIALRQSMQ